MTTTDWYNSLSKKSQIELEKATFKMVFGMTYKEFDDLPLDHPKRNLSEKTITERTRIAMLAYMLNTKKDGEVLIAFLDKE